MQPLAVLLIRRGIRDNLVIFLHKNIFCDLSLELSCQDGSNKGSRHMFPLRSKKHRLRIILNILFLSGALLWLSSHFYMDYRKNSKNWDTWNNYHNCPTIGTVGFYSAVLCSKDANRITNREDPEQTAPWGAVWSGSALFAQTYLSQYLKLLR